MRRTSSARFPGAVPTATIAKRLEREPATHGSQLARACHTANADCALATEIDEWQSFDDPMTAARGAVIPQRGEVWRTRVPDWASKIMLNRFHIMGHGGTPWTGWAKPSIARCERPATRR